MTGSQGHKGASTEGAREREERAWLGSPPYCFPSSHLGSATVCRLPIGGPLLPAIYDWWSAAQWLLCYAPAAADWPALGYLLLGYAPDRYYWTLNTLLHLTV